MRLALLFTLPSLTVACGDDSSGGPDAAENGFTTPMVTLRANMELDNDMWMELGPADLSCLNTPSTDVATTATTTLNTKVLDFQSGNAVPGAMVSAFKDIDYMNTFATATADGNANVSVMIPSGVKRYGFRMTSTSSLPTFLLNQYVDPTMVTGGVTTNPSKIQTVSNATAATLPAIIGQTRQAGTGIIAGAMRDCQKHEISGFIATISSTPMTASPIGGADTYYFDAGLKLPAHHDQQPTASSDGLFMIIQIPPTTSMGYVQLWGFPTEADLAKGMSGMKMIGQLQVPVVADTVITGSYDPLRQ